MKKIKYLIIAETSDIGYFVEIVEEYELALKREKLFFELAFNPPADRNFYSSDLTHSLFTFFLLFK